jgi:hypothetical protein
MKSFVQDKKTIKFAIILLILTLIAEIFVFNYSSVFHLLGADYRKTELNFDDAVEISGFYRDGNGSLVMPPNTHQSVIEFKGLNQPVGTIGLIMETDVSKHKVWVHFSDSTWSSSYRWGTANADIINDNPGSKVIVCHFSGDTKDLRINFGETGKDKTMILQGIVLNMPVPFKFSFLRFFGIIALAVLIYVATMFAGMRLKLRDNFYNAKLIAWVMTVVMLCGAYSIIAMFRVHTVATFEEEFSREWGNQITQGLVDAFREGKVTLIDDPNDPQLVRLAELNNPYDWGERMAADIHTPWDHLYFEGKIYSYYGIAPVLTLFLPYNLFTGYYFPNVWAIFFYGTVGIIFLTKTYLVFMRKFFPNLPTGMFLAGLLILQVSSGIWYCFPTPNFYEIAQSSGFAAVTCGAYFLLSSNIIGDGKRSHWRLILSSSMLAMAVLCRPTLAVYCVVAVMIIAAGYLKLKREEGNTRNKTLIYFFDALMPFVVIGGIQMIYNYMRFGSVFEFGIQYSLTINDFTRAQYHTRFAMIGLYNFLLVFPNINSHFPFIHSAFDDLRPNGYYFVANRIAIGLFWRALPMFAYLYAGKALKYLPGDRRQKLITALLVGVGCVLAPLIIIFSIWESGYGVRYCVDFNWQMILGAFSIAFLVYTSVKGKNLKRHLYNLFIVSAALSLIVNLATVIDHVSGAFR